MLSELCVRRPVFATMLVMSLVVLGIFSFRDLGVDLFPRADPATVNVQLALPGASPDEMATSVIEPMEETLSSVSGIDEMSSMQISEGKGNITIKFVLERDINDAANDVREKVSAAMANVPPQLLPPVITKVDPDSDPVMSVVVSSDSMSLRTLTEIADKQVKRAIEAVNGVGEVDLGGGRAREIHIVVDLEKLNSYGLSIDQVRDAVVNENTEIPGGTVEQGKSELLLRTLGRIDASDQFNNIVVATKNGTPIRVSDIGYAEDSNERPTQAAWLGDNQAVILDIKRAMGENTVEVIEGVKKKIAIVQRSLPKAVTLTITRDDSKFIYASIASLEEHLIWGSFFAAVVVMFFIRNIRAVVISAVAIPASIIATFTLMRAMNFTLNNMTLLGITLAVGIVIDDAIVVLENIFRYIEEKQCTPFEAAIQGTREVALAVMATTLSLVVIFLPVAFMTGYARRYINPFGWTMAFSIMVSMLVSFTLTPMLSSRFLKLSDAEADHKTKDVGFFHWLDTWYTGWVEWALDHPRLIIVTSIVVFLLTFPLNRMVGRTFVPVEDMGEWTIHIDTPEGTSLEGSGEYDEAFAAFERMNDIILKDGSEPEARAAAYREQVRAQRDAMTADWAGSWRAAEVDDRPSPAFLVGFPRSGTTLLDTILMSHESTEVLEEEPTLVRATEALGGFEAIADASDEQIRAARDAYFEIARTLTPLAPGKLLIDKNPLSMNSVAAIRRIFPDAKIILALRHPCDVVLSCYVTNFKPNNAMANFLHLDTAAELYDLSFGLFEKSRELLNPAVHVMKYEKLVEDRDRELRPLLDFLGLDWDNRVLDHESTARARGHIKTASYAQVVEPIYKRSAGRWQNYRKHIEPALPVIEPWVAKFGYSL